MPSTRSPVTILLVKTKLDRMIARAERGHDRLRATVLDRFGVDLRTVKLPPVAETLRELREVNAAWRAARQAPPRDDRVLRVAEVMKLTGLSRTTLWKLARAGSFPKPVKLTGRAMGWKASAVAAWLAERTS